MRAGRVCGGEFAGLFAAASGNGPEADAGWRLPFPDYGVGREVLRGGFHLPAYLHFGRAHIACLAVVTMGIVKVL